MSDCTVKEVARESEVSAQNVYLENAINELESLMEDFFHKIQPIVNERPEPTTGESKNEVAENLCEVANALRTHGNRITMLIRKIRTVKGFIEV